MSRAVGWCGITKVLYTYLECECFRNHTFWFFFVTVVISMKQKDSSAVEIKLYALLGSVLEQ